MFTSVLQLILVNLSRDYCSFEVHSDLICHVFALPWRPLSTQKVACTYCL